MNDISLDTCLAMYRLARLIRRTQEVLIEEYARQEMRCPMHFCIGQEATPTALGPLFRPEDSIMSHYRSHGYFLAKGGPLREMIAEFHGKVTGSNGGVAGSMELAHEDCKFHSGAIVGGPVAIAMGMAYALKYQDQPGIVVAISGDGSLDEGLSYEALNLAALHEVPLLTICENNLYAAHTPEAMRTKSRSIIDRVTPFGMPAERLDSADIIQLHLRLRQIVEQMRAGGGPRFLEIQTYRYCGHVGPENDDWLEYRTPQEIAVWRKRDAVPALRVEVLKRGAPERTLNEIEAEIEREISGAFAAARADAFPELAWSFNQVLSNGYAPIVKEFGGVRHDAFDSAQPEARLKAF